MAVGNFEEGMPKYYAQGLYEESSTAKHRLGTKRETADGRRFVYCKATAAAIAAGICVGQANTVQACTVAATDAAINLAGVKKVTLTLTGTPTLNLYQDGFMMIKAGTGIGEVYRVRGNTADDVPASGRCTIYLYDALKATMVAASSTVDLYQNPYGAVLINPAIANATATTGFKVLGVTQRPVTASYYFWAQTWGIGTALLVVSTSGAEANERQLIASATSGYMESVTGSDAINIPIGELMEMVDQDNGEATLVNILIG